jgi:hypothetical protein
MNAHFRMVDKHLSLHFGSSPGFKDILNDEG